MTLWKPMNCSMPDFPSFTILWSFLKLMSIESVIPSNHLILCFTVLSLPKNQDLFQWVSSLHQVGQSVGASTSASALPMNIQVWFPLIFFRIHWFYLLAAQGTLKSLLQHYNLKESVLWNSAFFTVTLSHLYMTTGKSRVVYTDLCQQSDVSAF